MEIMQFYGVKILKNLLRFEMIQIKEFFPIFFLNFSKNSIFDPKIVENIDFAVRKMYVLDFLTQKWSKNIDPRPLCNSN